MANNQQDYNIYDACDNNDIESVKKFISEGADLNAKYKYGFTPLDIVVIRCNTEIADLLISNGANVNPEYPDKPDSPLHLFSFQTPILKKIQLFNLHYIY